MNFNPKGNENNLTVFKYEDLIERAGQFGGEILRIYPNL